MTDNESRSRTEKVADEGAKLMREVETLLDNPEHVFADGTGEAWASQLDECARECRRYSLNTLARSLEDAARRVTERSEIW